jgi:hypothetical protein
MKALMLPLLVVAMAMATVMATAQPTAPLDQLLSNATELRAMFLSGAMAQCYTPTGQGNNQARPSTGVTGSAFHRVSPAAYADGAGVRKDTVHC